MVLRAGESITWEGSGPLPDQAKQFIQMIEQRLLADAWQDAIQNNPGLISTLNTAERMSQEAEEEDRFSLQQFYDLHSREFPQTSIALLNISAGLFEDLLWADVYFIEDLKKKLEDGDFIADDILQAKETYEEALSLLRAEIARVSGGGSGQVNGNAHFVM